ncbi:MAG TPA: antibiotic biosynthesis monooxygenase [Gammaproteobacteria bacterium]|nr:antibiotic biosynthesis monooxygenase [Gammaproteobacteria bacterium]MCH78637.1 antibiotic biosynthesis monooxygenase [Gammaproteobacteria bacterium]
MENGFFMAITSQEPVTVSIARRVRPGKEQAYESWVRQIIAAVSRYPGHLGVAVLRPEPGRRADYVLVDRFDSLQHQQAWEQSAERAGFLQRLADLTEGEERIQKVSGLEFWFSLPEVPAEAVPRRHRMTLVITLAVFVLGMTLNGLFGDVLAQLPLVARVAVLSIVQVLVLSYLLMPRLTALFKHWLYDTP